MILEKRQKAVKIELKPENMNKIAAQLSKGMAQTPLELEAKKVLKRRREQMDMRAADVFGGGDKNKVTRSEKRQKKNLKRQKISHELSLIHI